MSQPAFPFLGITATRPERFSGWVVAVVHLLGGNLLEIEARADSAEAHTLLTLEPGDEISFSARKRRGRLVVVNLPEEPIRRAGDPGLSQDWAATARALESLGLGSFDPGRLGGEGESGRE